MIIGIGTDIVMTERIKNLLEKHGDKIVKRILSDEELIFLPQLNRDAFLAGRFAVKEAVVKAFGKRDNIMLRDIEVLNDDNGKPYISNIVEIIDKVQIFNDTDLCMHVSISHEREYAIGFAVLECGMTISTSSLPH